MTRTAGFACVFAIVMLAGRAWAQQPPASEPASGRQTEPQPAAARQAESQQAAADQPSPIPLSRLAAGIRHYPAAVLRALLAVAADPLVLRQLADDPALVENPDKIVPAVPDATKAAIRELAATPALIAVAAAHPAEMKLLRQVYADAPEGMEQRIAALRAAYDVARIEAAAAWQAALAADPAAQEKYGSLLTEFTRAQQSRYDDFPFVHVTSRDYYRAAPPNDAIMAFAESKRDELGTLWPLLTRFWDANSPDAVDQRALARDFAPRRAIDESVVAARPPKAREGMWEPTGGAGEVADSIGFLPVIMQPLADQPAEARYAFAIADHARLWTPPGAADEAAPGAADEPARPRVAQGQPRPPREVVQPADDDDQPAEIIEQRIVEERYVEAPIVEAPIVEVYRPVYYYDPFDYYGATISYRHYYSTVFPYYCGYPSWSPVYVGCFPRYYPYGYGRHGVYGSVAFGGSGFHLGVNIGGDDCWPVARHDFGHGVRVSRSVRSYYPSLFDGRGGQGGRFDDRDGRFGDRDRDGGGLGGIGRGGSRFDGGRGGSRSDDGRDGSRFGDDRGGLRSDDGRSVGRAIGRTSRGADSPARIFTPSSSRGDRTGSLPSRSGIGSTGQRGGGSSPAGDASSGRGTAPDRGATAGRIIGRTPAVNAPRSGSLQPGGGSAQPRGGSPQPRGGSLSPRSGAQPARGGGALSGSSAGSGRSIQRGTTRSVPSLNRSSAGASRGRAVRSSAGSSGPSRSVAPSRGNIGRSPGASSSGRSIGRTPSRRP